MLARKPSMAWTEGRVAGLSLILLFTIVAFARPLLAQQDQILADGQNDYEQHCAACHGVEGRGDGRMASILILPPSDLTQIRTRHDGDFPFWRVYAIIYGGEPVQGHDTFQMPEGQARFRRYEGRHGSRPAYIRVLELTHYLESIQSE